MDRFRTIILMMNEPTQPSLDQERQSDHVMIRNIGNRMPLSNVAFHGNDVNEAAVGP